MSPLPTTPHSALEAYDRYLLELERSQKANAGKIFSSLIVRRIVPALGGSSPAGARTTPAEQQAALSFLEQVSVGDLQNLPVLLEQAFSAEESEALRRGRSVIKQFYERLLAWGCFQEKKSAKQAYSDMLFQNKHQQYRFHSPNGQPRKDWRKKNGRHYANRFGRSKRPPYALMAMKPVNTRGERRIEQVFPEDYVNQRLQKELDDWKDYCRERKNSPGKIKKEEVNLMQLLGWLHRFRGISLEDLSLYLLIEYSPLYDDLSEISSIGIDLDKVVNDDLIDEVPDNLINQMAMKKMVFSAKAENAALKNREKIEDFLRWMNRHPNSSIAFIDAFSSLAAFVYRLELSTVKYEKPSSIPTIREIQRLRREYDRVQKFQPPSVPFHLKSVPWEECIRMVEKLRQRYEEKYTYPSSKRTKSGVTRRKRTEIALSKDLQDFLSAAFMILIPPDRSRTFYELEMGKTFVYGEMQGRSFTPVERMKHPQQARWYIHLEMEDYKTGKAYGTYWAPIPNTVFPDGQELYHYIEQWLSWGRPLTGEPDHNFFFLGIHARDQLNHSDWCGRIVTMTDRETGVGVSPKELRKIYISYLKSSRASRAELEAARLAQHHSQKMQDTVYDQQEQMDKLQPIYDFNEEVVSALLESMNAEQQTAIVETAKADKQKAVEMGYDHHLGETQKDFDVNIETVRQVFSK